MAAEGAARKLLAHIAVRVGGVEGLASMLEVQPDLLRLYITGAKAVPDSLLLRVVDILLDQEAQKGKKPVQPSSQSSQGRKLNP